MIYKVFSVYDKQADYFGTPLCFRTVGEARRSFFDACAGNESQMSKSPSDFHLYQIGEFDDNTGLMKQIVPVEFVAPGDAAFSNT